MSKSVQKKPDPSIRTLPRRVILVDDHPIMRDGLAQLIGGEPDLMVCGQFEEATPAMDALPDLKPDIAIVDLSLKGSSGLDLVKSIKTNYPKIVVLVLSMYD